MIDLSQAENQIQYVTTFHDLVTTPFSGTINALCWTRNLLGDFSEIVELVKLTENMVELHLDELQALQLSVEGNLAREILIHDMTALKALGAAPTLNVIKSYDRDDSFPFFPTDVYSFHVDRSPVPVDTYLCTYYGDSSEILPNSQGTQKVLIPEIRNELKKIYDGPVADFEAFLSDEFFDLHYQANPNAQPTILGVGNLCKLAIDHPQRSVPPCLHRAPFEKGGQKRLLLIC